MQAFKLAQGKKLIGVFRGEGAPEAFGAVRSIIVDRVDGFRVTTMRIDTKDTGDCLLTYKLREVPVGSIIVLKRNKDRVLGPIPGVRKKTIVRQYVVEYYSQEKTHGNV